MTNTTSTPDALRQATTDQGLDPVVAALDAAEINHTVADTGGGVLVVEIPVDYEPTAFVGITENPHGFPGYCVVFYSAEAAAGTAEGEILTDDACIDSMVAIVRSLLGADTWS